jgi:hypothetical protein
VRLDLDEHRNLGELVGLTFTLFRAPSFSAVSEALVRGVENGPLFVTAWILIQTVTLSLTAIFGTLLFFDLRARARLPWEGTPARQPGRSRASGPVAAHLTGRAARLPSSVAVDVEVGRHDR